jgi:hypothetical protein
MFVPTPSGQCWFRRSREAERDLPPEDEAKLRADRSAGGLPPAPPHEAVHPGRADERDAERLRFLSSAPNGARYAKFAGVQ